MHDTPQSNIHMAYIEKKTSQEDSNEFFSEI